MKLDIGLPFSVWPFLPEVSSSSHLYQNKGSHASHISNSKDYPAELINALVKRETPEYILQQASWTHFYVVEDDDRIVDCGAIGPYWNKPDESSLFTIFVHPHHQGKGVGRTIMETLEKDEFALRAKRIEIPASITGLPFYQKMGYSLQHCQVTSSDFIFLRLTIPQAPLSTCPHRYVHRYTHMLISAKSLDKTPFSGIV